MVQEWAILQRLNGYVDTLEIGQTRWSPLFRSRRLSEGSRFRVQSYGKACLNLADRSRLIFTADHQPIVAEVHDYQIRVDHWIVFNAQRTVVMQELIRILGVNRRFEIQEGGTPMAARG